VLEGPPRRVLLIDLGLSPRQTRRRLQAVGLAFADVTDVLLTHLDLDHFGTTWPAALHRNESVTVLAHRRHRDRLRARGLPASRTAPLDDDGVLVHDGATSIRPVHVPHDEDGAVAFVIGHGGVRLGYATDLGRVTTTLLEAFDSVDVLALESNYDPTMQADSPRPEFLKRRIMGGAGHLSNEECLNAATTLHRRRPLQHLALLHLSRQCNCPRLVRGLYRREAPSLADRLVIADQHEPTRLLSVTARPNATVRNGPPVAERQSLLFESP